MSLQNEYCLSVSSFRVNGGPHVVGNILFQPRPDFPTELFLIFGVLIGEIHPLSSERKLVPILDIFQVMT